MHEDSHGFKRTEHLWLETPPRCKSAQKSRERNLVEGLFEKQGAK